MKVEGETKRERDREIDVKRRTSVQGYVWVRYAVQVLDTCDDPIVVTVIGGVKGRWLQWALSQEKCHRHPTTLSQQYLHAK